MRWNRLKIALVDDEQEYLDEMTRLCRDFGERCGCQIETVPFTTGETFLNAFSDGGFSVVFMDIYMEGIDGIAAALKMREQDNRCILVFLTSSTEFMPDAFSCHAFEYITKPFSLQRVESVLQDVLKVLPPAQKYIKVSSERKTVRVFLDQIASVVTSAHYLNISLTDGKSLRCRMTMPAFMRLTEEDDRFITINKGIAVNADYVHDFDGNSCILENGMKLPIRVRNRLKIVQALQDHHFNKIRSRQRHGKELSL